MRQRGRPPSGKRRRPFARETGWSDDMAFLEGSRSVAEGSEPVAVEASETFEDFYVREYRAIVGLAYALSGSRSGAEDLAQEAVLVAPRGGARIGRFDDPGVGVRRVVANLSVSAIRRRVVEAKALARMALEQTPTLPELSAEGAEFWRAVRSLPRRQAQ